MDIIVTTPKSQMKAAAQEAADCIAAGGGEYFRRFTRAVAVIPGDRVFYVEDGYVRGFAVVSRVEVRARPVRCETTGHLWPPGTYVFMAAPSWHWIRPIPMRGFQGWRTVISTRDLWPDRVKIIGNWLAPRPGPVAQGIAAAVGATA